LTGAQGDTVIARGSMAWTGKAARDELRGRQALIWAGHPASNEPFGLVTS